MNLSVDKNSAFIQYTGDLIDGYAGNADDFIFQLTNFKHATEPVSHYIPFYTAMGNHESVCYYFENNISIPNFPVMRESAEVNFAKIFVNPENGPISEDNESENVQQDDHLQVVAGYSNHDCDPPASHRDSPQRIPVVPGYE